MRKIPLLTPVFLNPKPSNATMKTNSSSLAARATISTLLLVTGICFSLLAVFTNQSKSANPTSGTLNSVLGTSVSWDGTATGGMSSGDDDCVEGENCDTYTL